MSVKSTGLGEPDIERKRAPTHVEHLKSIFLSIDGHDDRSNVSPLELVRVEPSFRFPRK